MICGEDLYRIGRTFLWNGAHSDTKSPNDLSQRCPFSADNRYNNRTSYVAKILLSIYGQSAQYRR